MSLIKVAGDGALDPAQPMTYAPAYYLLKGRAQGFAATLGDGRITPEHVLLALLWAPASTPLALPPTWCGAWAAPERESSSACAMSA
jgi:hypothetical protein